MNDPRDASQPQTAPYRVLARTYRPTTFAELIGQEALVRTLTNAIATGRLAHAFVLTGVRGVGKTTTARIIARALNCVGPDGTGTITAEPCGVCDPCLSIAQDRHVDVIEMDAASRTGVNDIRELIDGVRYKPIAARFKVYIIDEVHMLSVQAFNALLKTLEEPPEHVTFVFATTEIRKLPVTVLSRCQRFDLRRVEAARLATHLSDIAGREEAAVTDGALRLLAHAADGSVRDGLSLLDQALATYREASQGGGITAQEVRDMLGLVDRTQLFDLYDALMAGEITRALALVADGYRDGADPVQIVQDLLELTHWLTRLKLSPAAAGEPGVAEAERVRGGAMAERLSVATLSRAWQMLLKGLAEARQAPMPIQAVEMLLVRMAHAAELPTPAELVARIATDGGAPKAGPGETSVSARPGPSSTAADGAASAPALAVPSEAPAAEPASPDPVASARPEPRHFEDVVALLAARKEAILHASVVANVHLVRFEPGRIELRPEPEAPPDLAQRLGQWLTEWTDRRWIVVVSGEVGAPTLEAQQREAAERRKAEAARDPVVRAALETFPGAAIVEVRKLDAGPADGDIEAVEDDADPPREGV